jgi:hypothetical protein
MHTLNNHSILLNKIMNFRLKEQHLKLGRATKATTAQPFWTSCLHYWADLQEAQMLATQWK